MIVNWQRKLSRAFRNIKEKDILNIYKLLVRKQRDDINEIENYQLDQINKVIKHAYKNTTYYRSEFNRNEFLSKTYQRYKDNRKFAKEINKATYFEL